MGVKPEHQVELSNLLFGMSWEDPASDRRALAIKSGDTVTTISSGGCNTLTLLLDNPAKIFAVDINASQSHLLELKISAVRHLDREELLAFLGLAPSADRMKLFQKLADDLTPEARAYWTAKPDTIQKGVVHAGRYESFIGKFIRFLRVVQGKKRIENFFRCETLEEQKSYFDEVWNTLQWRLLFKLAFNKRMLAKRGLTADYFKFDDGSSSFAESFFRRSRHAMCEIPIAANYFLAQYLRGRYWSSDAVPDYLRKENLPIVKERLDRIEGITCDAQGWFARQPDSAIDAFSLSNICELMSPDEAGRLFGEIARTAKTGARVCFRNLIVPRGVPDDMRSRKN
jgi:S-adenosylmethionine-diacylglycerol 3-amino-3-carboxypropyl transferase